MNKPVTLNLSVSNRSRSAYWRAAIHAALATGGKLVFSHRERQNVYAAGRSLGMKVSSQMTACGEAVELVGIQRKGKWVRF